MFARFKPALQWIVVVLIDFDEITPVSFISLRIPLTALAAHQLATAAANQLQQNTSLCQSHPNLTGEMALVSHAQAASAIVGGPQQIFATQSASTAIGKEASHVAAITSKSAKHAQQVTFFDELFSSQSNFSAYI
ncbi:unnamed protein product [Anisakis simplex]|uniref:Uncharacterized protein n=1 Tax=Anisakis simplex TaxID=6269 RepID=A0A0M3KI68_ANISI|nr:unnamed protein product [Anisakis simplex]